MTHQDFLEKKVRTLFSRFDMDSNGTIEESDFDKWADNLVSLGNLPEDQIIKLRNNIKSLWKNYFAPADLDGSGDISVNELVAHFKTVKILLDYNNIQNIIFFISR